MDALQERTSPLPSADQPPIPRNPPLAPSQEMAYRKKCIDLKRRLKEIEGSNDATRKRIYQEQRYVDKQRLNRAILMNHLKQVMETPGKRMSQEELANLRSAGDLADHLGYDGVRGAGDAETRNGAGGEYVLDDSDDGSDDEEIPEPQERPPRQKRAPNSTNTRDSIISNVGASPLNSSNMYQHNTLQPLAPANSFSPLTAKDPAMLTSTFRVSNSTPTPAPSVPQQTAYQPVQLQAQPGFGAPWPQTAQSPHAQHHAPLPMQQQHHQLDGATHALAPAPAPPTLPPHPVRPAVPFEQFTAHMKPQLEADDYPQDDMLPRIKEEWSNMSRANRDLWEQRYHDQMAEFTHAMDEYKRILRLQPGGKNGAAVNGDAGRTASAAAFSSVNR